MTTPKTFLWLAALPGLAVACGKDEAVAPKGSQLAIEVKALSLEGIADARFTLRVKSTLGLVWEKTDLLASKYGRGDAGLSYVAPCDASAGANPHTVELELQALYDEGGDPIPTTSYVNPAPVGDPIAKTGVVCLENADQPVNFDLVIARDASQGFFDIAVNFDDIFCSAKFDCEDEKGDDLMFLHDPVSGKRAETVILALACTTGPGGGTTWLQMTDLVVECGPGPTTYLVDPAAGVGNVGGVDPIFFQTGIYQTDEQLPGYDKCSWNVALGVNEGPAAANCHVQASGTASRASWPTGWSTAGTIYPYVHYDVQLTDGEGQIMCGRHPIAPKPSPVTIEYTDFDGAHFAHEWQCGTTPTTTRIACDGTFNDQGITFTPSPDGVNVAFGNAVSQTYKLPGSYAVAGCCAHACCADDTP